MYRIDPNWVSTDLHPDSGQQFLVNWFQTENIKVIPVQHHHAHLAACG